MKRIFVFALLLIVGATVMGITPPSKWKRVGDYLITKSGGSPDTVGVIVRGDTLWFTSGVYAIQCSVKNGLPEPSVFADTINGTEVGFTRPSGLTQSAAVDSMVANINAASLPVTAYDSGTVYEIRSQNTAMFTYAPTTTLVDGWGVILDTLYLRSNHARNVKIENLVQTAGSGYWALKGTDTLVYVSPGTGDTLIWLKDEATQPGWTYWHINTADTLEIALDVNDTWYPYIIMSPNATSGTLELGADTIYLGHSASLIRLKDEFIGDLSGTGLTVDGSYNLNVDLGTSIDNTEIVDQTITKAEIDSTASNFVFDDAYRGTSDVADSVLATKAYVDLGVGVWSKSTNNDTLFYAHADDNDTFKIIWDGTDWYIGDPGLTVLDSLSVLGRVVFKTATDSFTFPLSNPTDNYILKWDDAGDSLAWEADATASAGVIADSIGDSLANYFDTAATVDTAQALDALLDFGTIADSIGDSLANYFDTATVVDTIEGMLHADNVIMDTLSAPTYEDVSDWFDMTQSACILTGGVVTQDATDSTVVDVTAGTGIIKTTDSDIGNNRFYDVSAGSNLAVADSTDLWVYVNYNLGSPVYAVGALSGIDFNTEIIVARVHREGNHMHITQTGQDFSNYALRMSYRLFLLYGLQRASGLVTSEGVDATNDIDVTAGSYYHGHDDFSLSSIASLTDSLHLYYGDGAGGFTRKDTSALNNTSYDDGDGTLGTLGNNRYGIFWVYVMADGELAAVYDSVTSGATGYILAGAELKNTVTTEPDIVASSGILIAKVIIEQGGNIVDIEFPWDEAFAGSYSGDHGGLAGLPDSVDHLYAVTDNALTDSLDNYLPLAGGAMVGAITTNSTFDGVDVGNLNTGVAADSGSWNATADALGTAIDSTKITDGSVSMSGDLHTFTEAELEGELSDVTALFTNNVTGDVTVAGAASTIGAGVVESTMIGVDQVNDLDINWGSGTDQVDLADIPGGVAPASAFDFGGATSFEIPNGADPTTDAEGEIAWDANNDAIEVYSGNEGESAIIPIYKQISIPIVLPDSVATYAPDLKVFQVNSILYPFGIEIDSVSILLESDAAYSMVIEEWSSADPSVLQNIISTVTTGATDTYAAEAPDNDAVLDAGDLIVLNIPATDVDVVTVTIIFHAYGGN